MPRYRGKVSIINDDVVNGIVDGNIMNLNDRILYTGTSHDNWISNRVYRWLGELWEVLEPPTEQNRQNAFYYLETNGDVTDGAPEAVFSLAQVRSLVASSIFATLIGAKNIIINTDGSIRSEVFNDTTGFELLANGNAIFNNLKLRGLLDANLSLMGGDMYPIRGAVREYAMFYYGRNGNNLELLTHTGYFNSLKRQSTGLYTIDRHYTEFTPVYPFNIIGRAYKDINYFSIPNYWGNDYTGGLIIINESLKLGAYK
jgi:hypothetical protein